MIEIFAKPAVGAIIYKVEQGQPYILIQTRNKENGGSENGMIEIPAGKVREYENMFTALRREVWEETGLNIIKIYGEENTVSSEINGYSTISMSPFCVTQNLSGGYSIILHTFICQAEGNLLTNTNETSDVHWEQVETVKEVLYKDPESFYPMHINALKKYFHENP
ncbi:NUDIX hydrolase [Lacrimispora sp. 38-1]|uniref:NUDIX hydrolase n=1 Tax=Lacrimispora sp. 38-1 TaxID=3125778 RepID=UPI003CF60436